MYTACSLAYVLHKATFRLQFGYFVFKMLAVLLALAQLCNLLPQSHL